MSSKPFTLEEFHAIYSRVPRLTVEVVIKSEKGILLTLRKMKPYAGLWHIPGGTVYLRETLTDAVKRVAKEELGVEIAVKELLGYIEYMHPEERLYHAVGIAFLCTLKDEIFSVEEQASDVEFFKTLPENIVVEQKEFLEKTFSW